MTPFCKDSDRGGIVGRDATSAGSGLTGATLDAILRKTAALGGADALLQRQGNLATATLNALLLKVQTKNNNS